MYNEEYIFTCTKCGAIYSERPIMSPINGENICPECGIRESLELLHATPEEVTNILAIIRRYNNIRLIRRSGDNH